MNSIENIQIDIPIRILPKTFSKGYDRLTKISADCFYNSLCCRRRQTKEALEMNRIRTKRAVMCLVGIAACKIQFAGCFPFIPAFFAAAYLEQGGRIWVTVSMLCGMAFMLPLTAMAKYTVAMVVIWLVIRLSEWVNKGCFTWVAALSAGCATTLLSLGGGLLQMKNQVNPVIAVMEGIFVLTASMILSRGIHTFMEFSFVRPDPLPERGRGEERLRTYARSFQDLSGVFSRMNMEHSSFSSEEMGRMQNEITGKLCVSCEQCAACWEADDSPMYGYLSALLQSIRQAGSIDRDVELKMQEYCPYLKEMAAEALRVFERARLNMAWYNRLIQNREVIADQLDAMAYIMEDCARSDEDISSQKKTQIQELVYRAKERGIRIMEPRLWQKEGERYQLVMQVMVKDGCVTTKELTRAVCGALHRKMIPQKDTKTLIGKGVNTYIYDEEPVFQGMYGVARMVKDGAAVSGDNFSFLEPESGRLVLCLSDGMGSGSIACKESEMVIELVERFLEAGFDIETAVRMMNSAMVMKGNDDMFSTIDISEINLYDGTCNFYKIGASATFIRQSGQVDCLMSTNLPVGVSCHLDLDRSERRLENGDFLVMVSDGVLEYLHVPHPEETMQEIIGSIDTNNATILAKRIMERVLLYTGGEAPDDMTVMTAAIWEK